MKHLIKGVGQEVFSNIWDNPSPTVYKMLNDSWGETYYMFYNLLSKLNNDKITTNDYFSIYAVTSGVLNFNGISTQANGYFDYRINGGSWTAIVNNTPNIPISEGDVVNFRRTGVSAIGASGKTYSTFSPSFYYIAFGNVNSLLYGDDWNNPNIPPYTTPYTLAQLFYNQSKLLSAEYLALPTNCTTSANYCFAYMFYNCTNLLYAPQTIPTINSNCCALGMFEYCKNLRGINSTIYVESGENCCEYMFGYSGLANVPYIQENQNDTTKRYGYRYMFYNCDNLKNINSWYLNISFKEEYKCYAMFSECENLRTTIPIKGEVGDHACSYMFANCPKIKVEAQYNENPFNYVTKLDNYSFAYMFYNCTSIKIAYTPVHSHGSFEYQCMYEGCSNLKAAYVYGATIDRASCQWMFRNCKSLEEVWLYPIYITTYTTSSPGYFSYCGIFEGCDNLKKVYCFTKNLPNVSPGSDFLPDTNGTFYATGNWDTSFLNGWSIETIQISDSEDFYNNAWSNGSLTMPSDIEDQSELANFFYSLDNYLGYYAISNTNGALWTCYLQSKNVTTTTTTTTYELLYLAGSDYTKRVSITETVNLSTEEYTYSINLNGITAEQLSAEDLSWYQPQQIYNYYYSITE